jgi:predicted NUDIX family NTP pyrophosphohydrolase
MQRSRRIDAEVKTLLPIPNVRRRQVLLLAGLLVLGTSVGAAAPTGSAPSFAAARSYATGRAPLSVAIGDLNGDRRPDLAVANSGLDVDGKTVSVLLNKHDGSFGAKRDYTTGRGPVSVAIGDLNGDRKPDLVTANNYANTVSVLTNRGDGSFHAKRDYATGRGPYSVAIGDLNGDRKPDLATANADANSVSVFINRGDGSFTPRHNYATGGTSVSVAIGDLNGDRKPDLATANNAYNGKTVSVLINRGDGSFAPRHNYATGAGPVSVAIGDLNGDRKPDLATANNAANTVSVLTNRGDGTFQAKRDYATGRGSWSVAIGDLNGDGKPELAVANADPETLSASANTVTVLANRGGGSFQAKRDYATGRHPFSVAIGDLNGDRKPDLATANTYVNTVSVLINTPGLCTVQGVLRKTVPAAKRTIARANCRVGRIRRAYSTLKRGRVISQEPKPGTVLPGGGKVNFVVSRGRKR